MENKRLYSPSQVREVLDRHGFTFSKGLGQNFLIDGNIVRKIVKSADITKDDYVIEIGPGMGTLTEELALNAKKVIAIEIDERLRPVLAETLEPYDNVDVVYGDVLKLPLKEIIEDKCEGQSVKVVANLPYYVTTPIIGRLIEEDLPLQSISVMVQKEVADRMVAKPHTKDYGSLTLFVGFYTEPQIMMKVPKTVFMPQPKIDSSVIKLNVRKELPDTNRDSYFKLVRAAFSKRRKTLINALSTYGLLADKEAIREALKRAGIEESVRGEDLEMDDYVRLARELPNL
ncbi:16S rRNA (adenine(1518)-N(6)/adenine(1519)-N(6))-dimethyltransferase RsmA [Gudongella sp. SC589]|jgi:16S rRNA (adenine1518-N6/adenine1519-N6)-dimethyltransferase|uniref:16S rRNA (adenine(1518)-N(6)/adenine(1519)-N(6))- dimethyltransferase RsmA n=1 Tax=Gudongella sp. SC589 TaxID=3385990 RepID=UPI00390476B7